MQTNVLLLFALLLVSLAACSHTVSSPHLPLSSEPERAVIVTSPQGTGIPAEENYAELRERLDRLLADVRIGFALGGDAVVDSRPVLIEVARSAGFQVVADPKKANLLITGEVRVEKVDNPSSPWQWLLATLSGEFVDTKGVLSLGTLNESCREGAPDPARARAIVLQTLAEQTAAGIRQALIRAISGDNTGAASIR